MNSIFKNENYIPYEQPKIIYKYRNWEEEFQKDVLRNNEMYLASPEELNDPFDLDIFPDFSIIDDNKKLSTYVHSLFPECNPSKKNDIIRSLKDNKEELESGLKEILNNSKNKYYGILCLAHEWNNILMWSHYAKSHKGYCIGFHFEKLKYLIKKGIGGPINYNDYYPKIELDKKAIGRAFDETHTKAKDWMYEKEYRMIVFDNFDTPKNQRKLRFTDGTIAEVNIGFNCNNEDKKEIIKICKNKSNDIKIFQVVKVKNEFKLSREEII